MQCIMAACVRLDTFKIYLLRREVHGILLCVIEVNIIMHGAIYTATYNENTQRSKIYVQLKEQ